MAGQPEVVVTAFYMEGCEACDEFMPRFRKVASEFPDVAFVCVDIGTPVGEPYAERFRVRLTPTVMTLRRRGQHTTVEGSMDDHELRMLFWRARA
jgi:thiol-disulfide isomerase/thioredoxin